MKDFTIRSPQEVRFGWGAIGGLPQAVSRLGKRPLLVTGGASIETGGRLAAILTSLTDAGLAPVRFQGVEHDPSVETIDRGRGVLAAEGCDCVVAIGGGSVMDAGKAIAGLAGESAPTAEFVAGKAITARCLPMVACTTTSGTGSEVTHVAVLTDHSRQVKASIRTEGMMPAVAIVDPELTVSMSPETTAFTGLDALTQALESYISIGANPFSDPLALQAATLLAGSIRKAVREGTDRAARENMAAGSMLAGLALASARLGLVHGLAHPLGVLYNLAHGQACALLLPHVLEFNAPVAEAKLASLARACRISSNPVDTAAAYMLVVWVRELCAELGCLQPLATLGLRREDFGAITTATMSSGSTKANPRPVTEADVTRILNRAA